MYVLGSLVGGGFDTEHSDIDLLAMVETDVTTEELLKLAELHQSFTREHPEWDDRIEVAYVSFEAMKHFKTTTSRIVRISPGELLHYRDMDIQWLMDWHMVLNQGVTVFGPPPSDFMPHITNQEFIGSLKARMPLFADTVKEAKHVGYQSYVILSLCRNLYAIQFGHQVSKIEGGHWAANEYPEWKGLIEQAMLWHGSANMSANLSTQADTERFANFALSQVDVT